VIRRCRAKLIDDCQSAPESYFAPLLTTLFAEATLVTQWITRLSLVLAVVAAYAVGAETPMVDWHAYPTKFGKLEFVDRAGHGATFAASVELDGAVLLKSAMPTGENVYRPSFMTLDFMTPYSSDFATRKAKSPPGNAAVYRMIIGEGEDGNCIRHFVLLDFTGDTPYVSNRFGYNPDGKFCLTLDRVKWTQQGAAIYLNGPMKYIYRTRR
jgi:hypothetical protein